MLRPAVVVGLAVAASAALLGQTTPTSRAKFEVATIKAAPLQPIGHSNSRTSVDLKAGRLDYRSVTFAQIFAQAYSVPKKQMTLPDWSDQDRFDIAASFPPGTPRAQVPIMLQALLADRFGVTVHRESKELPVYLLEVAKGGSRLKATQGETGIDSDSNGSVQHVVANIPLSKFAEYLSQRLDRPVLDRTGLAGAFRFTLDWSPDDAIATPGTAPGASIFTAVQEQLGLRLTPSKAPIEATIVDHAERKPSEN